MVQGWKLNAAEGQTRKRIYGGKDGWAKGATRWTIKDLLLIGILLSSVSKALTARSLLRHMKHRHLVSVLHTTLTMDCTIVIILRGFLLVTSSLELALFRDIYFFHFHVLCL